MDRGESHEPKELWAEFRVRSTYRIEPHKGREESGKCGVLTLTLMPTLTLTLTLHASRFTKYVR